MRLLLYDRIIRLEKHKSIIGIKNFALSEEFYRGHFAKVALVPGVILIEAMAQLLGWLIGYSHDFHFLAIMSVIEGVSVRPSLRPGFQSQIHAEIISTSSKDSLGKAWIAAEGEVIASLDRIIYSHFQTVSPGELSKLFQYYSGLTEAGGRRAFGCG